MKVEKFIFILFSATFIYFTSSCNPSRSPEYESNPSASPFKILPPTPSIISTTLSITTIPSITTTQPIIDSSTMALIQLPYSMRVGATLNGSGGVDRASLTYEDLITGSATVPVDDSAYALPETASMPMVNFEGHLQLSRGTDHGYEVIRDDFNYAADQARFDLPDLDLRFVADGSFLIPVVQGLVYNGNAYWNYIIGPGRIWHENSDHGYARASFPITLVERNQNCTHNGVMTFLFNGTQVSPIRYQITQETCLYFKFNMWGILPATYIPETITQTKNLKAAYEAELKNRLPTRPIEKLALDYPQADLTPSSFGSGINSQHMTAYGLVMNGINYVSDCPTRYGQYAYCESMRLPSYSIAKSAFSAVALMLLGQKYSTNVYNLLIKDLIPEAANAKGDWSMVTIRNTMDMSTGNYQQVGFEADEGGAIMDSFLMAESYSDKIKFAFLFPFQTNPGKVWIYHTSDYFLATQAMNKYLMQNEGDHADIFNLVRDEVYIPQHLSEGGLTTLRTDNRSDGNPLGGYGLFLTQDDIAKIGLLLNNQNGIIEGNQILEPGLLSACMQKDKNDRGLNTSGFPVFKYRNGFWAKEWTPSENRRFTCSFWTPFMSGYGGITVVMMPNNSIYYYFSDNNEFNWNNAVVESNKINPMCPLK